jgi:predicted neuraminidase
VAICLVAEIHAAEKPWMEREPLFAPEKWHNHASSVVETPKGGLLVCWFHGSGERNADDVVIRGSRKMHGSKQWSNAFLMADTPGFPDCNPVLFVDPGQNLWLFHVTILANSWESALLRYRVSSDYERAGSPRWKSNEVISLKPGPEFVGAIKEALPAMESYAAVARESLTAAEFKEVQNSLAAFHEGLTNKLFSRLGWMTRIHPLVLDGQRLLVPVYHDGYSCSLFAITDDWGGHWHTSAPLIGGGNVQPSVVRRKDGSLFTIMRDNGPPPNRAMVSESYDRGETWSKVVDSEIRNPGSSLEMASLRSGRWLLVGNDSEDNRKTLVVWGSDDEGRSWKWKRELAAPGPLGKSFSYPSLIQARDGSIHVTFSAFGEGESNIVHCRFNEPWLFE